MRSTEFYNDMASNIAYGMLKEGVRPLVDTCFPNHELSHVGFRRDTHTEEVVITLHINQIGRIKVAPNYLPNNLTPIGS